MKSPHIVTITDQNFATEVAAAPVPVLLDFSTTWCPPCRQMDPLVEALAAATQGRLRVGACDIEDNYEVSTRFGVQSAPTFLLLKDGKVVDRIVGAVPRARLEAMVGRVLG